MVGELEKYDFSYTSTSLRLQELLKVATAMQEGRELDFTNELGGGKTSTGKRRKTEFEKRLKGLTPDELELLIHGDLISQRQLAYISICKTFGFIRDFTVEVLREKLLVFDYQITDGDYITFFRRKAELYPEMEELSDVTVKKLRQVLFRMLEEAGLIDSSKSRVIQPQIVDHKLIDVVLNDNPKWLKVLLLSDHDIALMRK
jgi:hypothetical protein